MADENRDAEKAAAAATAVAFGLLATAASRVSAARQEKKLQRLIDSLWKEKPRWFFGYRIKGITCETCQATNDETDLSCYMCGGAL